LASYDLFPSFSSLRETFDLLIDIPDSLHVLDENIQFDPCFFLFSGLLTIFGLWLDSFSALKALYGEIQLVTETKRTDLVFCVI
jgi:hypothetical protein